MDTATHVHTPRSLTPTPAQGQLARLRSLVEQVVTVREAHRLASLYLTHPDVVHEATVALRVAMHAVDESRFDIAADRLAIANVALQIRAGRPEGRRAGLHALRQRIAAAA